MGLIRHCPRCRSDYRSEIARCADCEGELEDRHEETDSRFAPTASPEAPPQDHTPPPSEEASPLIPDAPPGQYAPFYFSYAVQELRDVSHLLDARGIPYRVEATQEPIDGRPPRTRYDLMVRETERAVAQEQLERYRGSPSDSDGAIDPEFDPASGYRRCPACSAKLPPGTAECPACGLGLGGEAESLWCSECGAKAGPSDESCPGCGRDFG